MKATFSLALVIAFLTACGSASNAPSPNANANQSANGNSSASGASGEAGKAPTPSPLPSTAPLSEGKTVTVRFPTGATEASYTDSFSGYGYVDYVFDAKAGQKMTAEITRADANRAILSVMKDGGPVETDASQVQGWTGLLPESGRYTVRVGQMRNQARQDDKQVKFSLLISIVDE